MKRRDFIKLAASGSVIATSTATSTSVQARENLMPLPNAVGMLYDSTLCIGCQACVVKCKEVNFSEQAAKQQGIQLDVDYLASDTLNVIQIREDGDANVKDQLENGFSYIKRQCMHCVDPNCVSACPVKALTKNPTTGIVDYDKDVCIGCRYCMMACPFNVPKYEYDDPFGQIQKCGLCNQKGVERLDNGELPGCVEVCPTGAVIYGSREELLAEAKQRLAQKQDTIYAYPRERVSDEFHHRKAIGHYEQHVYGEHEGGGTQVLVLTGIPHQSLGLPTLAEQSLGSRTETLQHGLYSNMVLPAAALGGLMLMARRNINKHDDSEAQEPKS